MEEFDVVVFEKGVWNGKPPTSTTAGSPDEAAETVCGKLLSTQSGEGKTLRAFVKLTGAPAGDVTYFYAQMRQ